MYKSDLLKEKHFSSENILKDSFKTFSWKEFLALIKLKDSMRFFNQYSCCYLYVFV